MTDSPQSTAAIDLAALSAVATMFRAQPPASPVPELAWGKSVGTVLQGIIVAALLWLGSVVVATSNATIRLEAGQDAMKEAFPQKNERDQKQDNDIAGLTKIATANAAAIATLVEEGKRNSARRDILEDSAAAAAGYRLRR